MQGRNFKYDSDLSAPPANPRAAFCEGNANVTRFSALCSAGRLASRLASTPHHLQQSMTLAFLENQLASALTLQSTQEYRYWLLIYTRFLVNEGDGPVLAIGPCVPTRLSASFSACAPGPEYHLRELCKELLGPVHKSATTSWEPTTLVGTTLQKKGSKCVCCFHLDWNHTCRVFNSSEKKSCQAHIFSHFAFYILFQITQILGCVSRVCGSEICCGRFCRSSARTCDSRDCSLNTRTSWSCCAINNTPTRLECPLNQYGLSKTLPVPLKPRLLSSSPFKSLLSNPLQDPEENFHRARWLGRRGCSLLFGSFRRVFVFSELRSSPLRSDGALSSASRREGSCTSRYIRREEQRRRAHL